MTLILPHTPYSTAIGDKLITQANTQANNTRGKSNSTTKCLSALDYPPTEYGLPLNGHSE